MGRGQDLAARVSLWPDAQIEHWRLQVWRCHVYRDPVNHFVHSAMRPWMFPVDWPRRVQALDSVIM